MDIRYAKMLKWFQHNHPDKIDRFVESVSPNQIRSKQWLVDELDKINELHERSLKIEIVGSWFGWPLVQFLHEKFDIQRIRLYDIDPFACKVARKYIEFFEYDTKITTYEISYWEHKQPDEIGCHLLINTSAEHMKESFADYTHNYVNSPIIALHSNNMYEEPDHCNCVDDEYELAMNNAITDIYFSGELNLRDEYNRFMVIGKQ